uniref:CSON003115 protein n=1 Tax=Culicoides sonorensis TaxID=179676 RepID=A0A336M4M5_CULSO
MKSICSVSLVTTGYAVAYLPCPTIERASGIDLRNKWSDEYPKLMAEILEVIVGIYEGYVCGYKLTIDRSSKLPSVQISKTFAGPLHTQSVRALGTASHYFASGGADDRVRVYDLKKRQEIRELLHHKGTINSVVFVDNAKYLITGGTDGQIAFINTKKWQLDKVWEKAHKGAVTCIAVHPEESLALTIGTDLVLKSWNLINGRNIYSTNLKNKTDYGGIVECIRWSPNGEHFALTGARYVEVLSLDTGSVVKAHKLENRVTDLCWIGDADILVGQDSGEMFFFNIENDESSVIPAHDTRLKAMFYVDNILGTISSGGDLSIWHISDDYTEIIQLREYNLDCRPTCLCIVETSKLGLEIPSPVSIEEDSEKPNIDFLEESEENPDSSKIDNQVEIERVIIEYENDLDMLSKNTKKPKKGKKKRKLEENETESAFIESTLNDNEPEEFKGQKKRKVIEHQIDVMSQSEKVNKKNGLKNRRKNKSKAKAAAMEFEVTVDVEVENDTNAHNGSSSQTEESPIKNKKQQKTVKSNLSKSLVDSVKTKPNKKKRSL